MWTQAASLDERVQFFDHRLFRRTKPDVAVVLDEGMISPAQNAGRICFRADGGDVDKNRNALVRFRVIDDDPQMVLSVDFSAAEECVAAGRHMN